MDAGGEHERNTMSKDILKSRWARLVCGCAILMAIGFIYGWSFFSSPIAAEFKWEPTTLSFTFTILMWCFCLGGIIGANAAARTSHRAVLIAAGIGIFASFVLAATIVQVDTPWILYITYGVIGGCSVGAAYTTAMGVVIPWFPGRAGLVSGLMLMFYSFSTMILSSVASLLFAAVGWRTAFIILSGVMGAVVILCALPARMPTASESECLAGAVAVSKLVEGDGAKGDGAASAEKVVAVAEKNYSTTEMLRKPAFYTYAIWMIIVSLVGLGIMGVINQLALESGAVPAAAVAAVGLLAVFNGIGRLFGGVLFDRFGTIVCMINVAVLLGVGGGLLFFAMVSSSVVVMFAGVVITGLGLGSTSVTGSSFMSTAFGNEHYSQNLSILNLTLIPAALIGPTFMSFSVTANLTYAPGTSVLAITAFVAIIFAVLTGRFLKVMQEKQ